MSLRHPPPSVCCGQTFAHAALVEHVNRVHTSWWIDVSAGDLVRAADGKRWDTLDVPPLRGSVDLAAVDRWVAEQYAE